MPALRKDLVADKGSTFTVAVQYTDSNEAPVDLTGYTASFVATTPRGGAIQTIAATCGSDGWINVKAVDEDTLTWPEGKQSYRLDLTPPSGDIERLFFGVLNVRGQVFQ